MFILFVHLFFWGEGGVGARVKDGRTALEPEPQTAFYGSP